MKADKVNFRGYGATPLKALVTRETTYSDINPYFYDMCEEVHKICKNEGIDVFVQSKNELKKDKYSVIDNTLKFLNSRIFNWSQDCLTFTPKRLIAEEMAYLPNQALADFFHLGYPKRREHIAGGNFFILPDDDTLLIGEKDFNGTRVSRLRSEFGMSKILPVSQPDFHIDLGIRPLNNRNVLVNSPQLTLMELNRCIENIDNMPTEELKPVRDNIECIRSSFIDSMKSSKTYKNFLKIVQELKNGGFNVIQVPASIINNTEKSRSTSTYVLNYMNAIVHERPDKSLVYITNKSYLDEYCGITPEVSEKIGFSFEKMFIESVKDYISPEDIHFVSGNGYIPDILEKSDGGIHCIFAEVPKQV